MYVGVGVLGEWESVVLEKVGRDINMKKARIQAVKDGTTEVIGGLIASVLTTVAIFIPIINMQEEAGQLFRDIALASSSAVGLSLLVSLLVLPTLSYQVHKITPNLKLKPIPIFSKISQKMVDLWNLCVQWIMCIEQHAMQSYKNNILNNAKRTRRSSDYRNIV